MVCNTVHRCHDDENKTDPFQTNEHEPAIESNQERTQRESMTGLSRSPSISPLSPPKPNIVVTCFFLLSFLNRAQLGLLFEEKNSAVCVCPFCSSFTERQARAGEWREGIVAGGGTQSRNGVPQSFAVFSFFRRRGCRGPLIFKRELRDKSKIEGPTPLSLYGKHLRRRRLSSRDRQPR